MRKIPLLLVLTAFSCTAQQDWRQKLEQEIPLLGHRNWIAIVDSAYPLQTSAGVETIDTHLGQIAVVEAVLARLKTAPHVTPNIFLDAELPYIQENEAKGIESYRTQLKRVLSGYTAVSLKHEQIIDKLDAAGKTFHVLVLKTNLTIPYTSVFLQLDCAYWDAAAEKRLRKRMAETPSK